MNSDKCFQKQLVSISGLYKINHIPLNHTLFIVQTLLIHTVESPCSELFESMNDKENAILLGKSTPA